MDLFKVVLRLFMHCIIYAMHKSLSETFQFRHTSMLFKALHLLLFYGKLIGDVLCNSNSILLHNNDVAPGENIPLIKARRLH